MTQSFSANLESPVDNPEALIRTTRSTKRRLAQTEIVVKRLALETYIQPQTIPLCNAIEILKNQRYNLKPSVLQLITTQLQFGGISAENSFEHLDDFTSLCDGLKGNNSAEVTKMNLFPYTLRDRVKRWLL